MEYYKKITKQLSWIYLIKIFDFLLMFTLLILLTRFLTEEEYGIYSILNITGLFITGIIGAGLWLFITVDLPGKSNAEKRKRFSWVFSSSTIITSISCISVILISIIALKFIDKETLIIPLIILIVTSSILILGTLVVGYLYAEKKSDSAKLLEFFMLNFWVIFVIALVVFHKINLNYVLLSKLFAVLIVIVVMMYVLKRNKILSFPRFNWKYVKKGLIFGLPTITLIISQWVISASDKYFLGIFHSAKEVAYYAFIYSMLNFFVVFFISSIDTAIYPHLVESYNKKKKDRSVFLLNAELKYGLILILPALVGFFVLREEIITMISGVKYLNALPILPILIIFPILDCLTTVYLKSLIVEQRTKTIALIYTVGAVVNVILNLVLVPKYSYMGAGASLIITYIIIILMSYRFTKEFVKFDNNFLRVHKIIFSSIVMGIVIYPIHPAVISTKILTIVLGGTVYCVMLLLTRTFVKEEIDLAKSILKLN